VRSRCFPHGDFTCFHGGETTANPRGPKVADGLRLHGFGGHRPRERNVIALAYRVQVLNGFWKLQRRGLRRARIAAARNQQQYKNKRRQSQQIRLHGSNRLTEGMTGVLAVMIDSSRLPISKIYGDKSWSFTMSVSILRTYSASILICSPFFSGASKLISSSTRSMIVCRRRAPMFSVPSFTRKAKCAISSSESLVNSSFTPSVSINAVYCFTSDDLGSVRMRMKSSMVSDCNSTRIGKRP